MKGAVVPVLTEAEVAGFWTQTARLDTGCLEWTGQRNGPRATSYGLFTIRRDGQKVRLMAHRTALAISTGIRDGVFACHHCDIPPCVEPSHLYWGDPKSNAADMIERGRGRSMSAEDLAQRLRPDPLAERGARWVRPDSVMPMLRQLVGEDAVFLDAIDWSYYRDLDALAAVDDIRAFVERVERGDCIATDWTGDDLITDEQLAALYANKTTRRAA